MAKQVYEPGRSAAPARRRFDKDVLASVALAFVAGFVDAAGFVALSGLFTSHVTGNFVLIGAELVTSASGVLAKLLALPAFVFGVAATRLIALALERRGVAPLRPLLLIEAGALLAFLAAGVALAPGQSPDAAATILVGMLGVAAMSVQNTIGRLALAHLASTTVMTINVTQAVIDAMDLFRNHHPEQAKQAAARLRRMLPAILTFAAGALAGAFGVLAVSFWCLLAPVAALLGLAAALG